MHQIFIMADRMNISWSYTCMPIIMVLYVQNARVDAKRNFCNGGAYQ